jgi:hypothetical protein
MGYYQLNDSDGLRTSDAIRNMPDCANSKNELINSLNHGFNKCRKDNQPIDFKWMCFFSGWSAGCGEIYVVVPSYLKQIGYVGPITTKTKDYCIVNSKHIKCLGKDLYPKKSKNTDVPISKRELVR